MRTRTSFIGIVLVGILGATAAFAQDPAPKPGVFRDANNGYFMFLPPKNWTTEQYPDPRTKVAFNHPSVPGVFIRFIVREAPAESFDAMLSEDKQTANQMKARGISCEVEERNVHGLRCSEVVAQFPNDGGTMMLRKFLSGGLHFNIQYSAPTKALFERHRDEAMKSLETITTLKAGGNEPEKAREQQIAGRVRLAKLTAEWISVEEARDILEEARKEFPDSKLIQDALAQREFAPKDVVDAIDATIALCSKSCVPAGQEVSERLQNLLKHYKAETVFGVRKPGYPKVFRSGSWVIEIGDEWGLPCEFAGTTLPQVQFRSGEIGILKTKVYVKENTEARVGETEYIYQDGAWSKIVRVPTSTAQQEASRKTDKGTIISVDEGTGDIMIKTDSGKTLKICDVYHYFGQVSQYLEVSVSGADFAARLKNFSDFKVGDRVEISYRPGHTELDSFKKVAQQSSATEKTSAIQGTIEHCDLDAGQLLIVKETGGEEHLTMARDIVVMAGDRKVSPSVLKKGVKATVTYAEQRGEPDPRMGVPIIFVAKQVRVDASIKDEPSVAPRFVDNGDGTVTDTNAKLMWQKGDNGEAVTFAEGTAYCTNLKLGGHTDWRLPKKEEKDNAIVAELMMPRHSKDMPADFYWSDDATIKLAFNFLSSHVLVSNIYGAKEGSRAYVRAVRALTDAAKHSHSKATDTGKRFRLEPSKSNAGFFKIPGAPFAAEAGLITEIMFNGDSFAGLGPLAKGTKLTIGDDGTLLVSREGIVVTDKAGIKWASHKVNMNGMETIVFLPESTEKKPNIGQGEEKETQSGGVKPEPTTIALSATETGEKRVNGKAPLYTETFVFDEKKGVASVPEGKELKVVGGYPVPVVLMSMGYNFSGTFSAVYKNVILNCALLPKEHRVILLARVDVQKGFGYDAKIDSDGCTDIFVSTDHGVFPGKGVLSKDREATVDFVVTAKERGQDEEKGKLLEQAIVSIERESGQRIGGSTDAKGVLKLTLSDLKESLVWLEVGHRQKERAVRYPIPITLRGGRTGLVIYDIPVEFGKESQESTKRSEEPKGKPDLGAGATSNKEKPLKYGPGTIEDFNSLRRKSEEQ
jgi:hypothetical protein